MEEEVLVGKDLSLEVSQEEALEVSRAEASVEVLVEFQVVDNTLLLPKQLNM